MMEKLENAFTAMEGNIAQRLSSIERRLESLETAVSCDKMTSKNVFKQPDGSRRIFQYSLTSI